MAKACGHSFCFRSSRLRCPVGSIHARLRREGHCPKLGGVARRRFIRRAGVVPRTKATSYRGSAQEPFFLVSPYRAHIRSAHARLRPAKEASRLFFLGAATPPNLA